MDEPKWAHRSYVVYAIFHEAGEDGSSVRRFAFDARQDDPREPCVGWSGTLHGRCFLHYGNVVEAMEQADRRGGFFFI